MSFILITMKISTIFVVLGLLIISFYCIVEVNYYASAQEVTKNISDTPYLEISKIGVDQAINNKSINYGVYHEPASSKPGYGTVVLFGHRTLHGSPFLRLNELKAGDNITLEWPGIGNVEYTVINSTIVPASYRLSVEQGKVLFLITCYPLGSSAQRLVIEAKQGKIYPIQEKTEKKPPNNPEYAFIIMAGFFAVGTILSYLYPVKEDKILIFAATVLFTLLLVVGYFYQPLPDAVGSGLSWMNSLLGV
ncbi:class E sortase [Methanobacterium aggregans]|uniref:class E sortase n=1 Tax=Methanobacterium aggregans TaxID=1615586 RepID=UPI001FDA00C6|nr:class E sortase [Methanobacterium aggregans]MBP2045764.1 LPXTG-site transpeptidase (sortase) family protein [Methanobacterium aggregans]